MMPVIRKLFPGFILSSIIAITAYYCSQHLGPPVMLLALLFGMALSFLYRKTQFSDGLDFVANNVLKTGVGLIGLRLAFSDLIELGWQPILLMVIAIFSTMLIGHMLARLANMPRHFGILSGGAVAICGSSAALAIAAVLPKHKDKVCDTALTIIAVTVLSSVAMILYPILTTSLDLSASQSGIFLGGSIHNVAQAVGAGYSVSQETGDIATLAKLVRVSLLVPVIMILIVIFKPTPAASSTEKVKPQTSINRNAVPLFLVVFIILMILNSLFELPLLLTSTTYNISHFALIMAMAAIGMKTSLKQLLEVGIRPVAIMLFETLWIAGLVFVYLIII